MKVWGIGLGRTGTKSLQQALLQLGLNTVHNPAFYTELLAQDIDGGIEGAVLREFKSLDLRFPDSKFILTSRPLRFWLSSCKKAIEELYPEDRIAPHSEFYEPMIRNRAARYGSVSYDEDTLIQKYYQHHADAVSHFKGRMNQLLIIDVTSASDSWSPLCAFLKKPAPDSPFPCIADR